MVTWPERTVALSRFLIILLSPLRSGNVHGWAWPGWQQCYQDNGKYGTTRKRSKGRPKKTWMKQIDEDMVYLKVTPAPATNRGE